MASEYAVPVHERSEVHHPHGKSHFLLDPVLAFADRFGSKLKDAAQRGAAEQGIVTGSDLGA